MHNQLEKMRSDGESGCGNTKHRSRSGARRAPAEELGDPPSPRGAEFDRVLSFFEIYLIASCVFALVTAASACIPGFW